jgi:thiosulfate/3-mercaptopyruvate sulfurtransferase
LRPNKACCIQRKVCTRTLASLATKAVGNDMSKEFILYCDTGKTCTSWAFVMTEILGYKDVKIYDGSAMEWLADPNAPMEPVSNK